MLLRYNEIDLRSFFIVFISFVGNAQINGFDLVLFVLTPAFLLLFFKAHWSISRKGALVFALLISLFSVIALQAALINAPYFDGYYLWPLKAILVSIIVSFGGKMKWPILNSIALGLVCFALFLIGDYEGGRFSSVFGPNMLYRIFGFLMLFSLANNMKNMDNHSGRHLFTPLLLIAFGAFGSFITGSSGALVIIALTTLIFLYQLKNTLLLVIVMLTIVLCVTFFTFPGSDFSWVRLSSFERIIYKLSNLAVDARLSGWIEILSDPISVFGRSHQYYNHLWNFGYSYPHNVFVELYAFFGISGALSIILILYACIVSLPLAFRGDTLSILFLVLLFGALFSGDLSDNYGVLGLSGGIAVIFWGRSLPAWR